MHNRYTGYALITQVTDEKHVCNKAMEVTQIRTMLKYSIHTFTNAARHITHQAVQQELEHDHMTTGESSR